MWLFRQLKQQQQIFELISHWNTVEGAAGKSDGDGSEVCETVASDDRSLTWKIMHTGTLVKRSVVPKVNVIWYEVM